MNCWSISIDGSSAARGVSALAKGLLSSAETLEWLSMDFLGNKGKKKISEVGESGRKWLGR